MSKSSMILDELKRQWLALKNDWDTLDTKLGTVLGFLVLFITLFLEEEFLRQVSINSVAKVIFALGLFSILISFAFGLLAFFLKDFSYGAKPKQLILDASDSDIKEHILRNIISRGILDSYEKNIDQYLKKTIFFSISVLFLVIGFIILVISKLIVWRVFS